MHFCMCANVAKGHITGVQATSAQSLRV